MKTQSVLISESLYLHREGLKSILDRHPHYEVADEAATYLELEKKLNHESYDHITIDISAQGQFGIDSVSLIQELAPSTNIVVISAEEDKKHIYEVLGRGVQQYITKDNRDSIIYSALEHAHRGEKYYCAKVLDAFINRAFEIPIEKTPKLTKREIEIISRIGSGKSSKIIAFELNLSIHTIYTHRKNILKKLKLKSPVELITYAINNKLVEI